jgi:hypothetical protein
MILLCLMWCIWREHNTRNLKDCEKTVIELKAIMFETLYVWIVAYNCSLFSNFLKFLDLCFSFVS